MATNFAFIGGDLRNIKLMNILSLDYRIFVYGLDSKLISGEVTVCETAHEAINRGHWIVGPVPFSVGKVSTEEILQALSPGKIFIAGKIPEYFSQEAQKRKASVIDILKRDDMAILNAVPTAEGAIQIAMETTPVTIDGSKTLITGFGKVAQALASRVKALGGHVTVCARKAEARALATTQGYTATEFYHLKEQTIQADVVFNTVPQLIFDKPMLEAVAISRTGVRPPGPVLIDLASLPGGFDSETAKALGFNLIHALALPGKVAPETAAANMAKVISNIIKEKSEEAIENAD